MSLFFFGGVSLIGIPYLQHQVPRVVSFVTSVGPKLTGVHKCRVRMYAELYALGIWFGTL